MSLVSTWAQGRMLRGHYRPYRRAFTGKKLLTVHAKMDWTLRPARRQTASAVSTLQCNRAHRLPTLTFTNQHRSYYRLLAGGSGFGYMRDGQKKKEHECCAAHFSFISTNILSTTPRTKNVSVGHALLIWFTEWPHENQTLTKFRG